MSPIAPTALVLAGSGRSLEGKGAKAGLPRVHFLQTMTKTDFRQLLAGASDADLIGPCLRDPLVPFAFDTMPNTWDEFKSALAREVDAADSDITVVGSGRFGFSLKPDSGLKPYSDSSDIDVVVVSASLFDRVWLSLLRAVYPDQDSSPRLGSWLAGRRREIYAGWINPLEIKLDRSIWGRAAQASIDLSARWFNSFQKVSQLPPRRHGSIEGRLYRTWDHAELYHLHSLAALRSSLEV